MIEVPEYLLERSRQRRAELTGESTDADDAAGAAGAAVGSLEAKPPGLAQPPARLPAQPPITPVPKPPEPDPPLR